MRFLPILNKLHFMTLDKLDARHQKELKEYYRDYERRLAALEKEQNELIDHCVMVNPKTHHLVKTLLQEQRNAWNETERDELDMLKHIQSLERESFLDKQAKREELAVLLSRRKSCDKDHGR